MFLRANFNEERLHNDYSLDTVWLQEDIIYLFQIEDGVLHKFDQGRLWATVG